MLLKGFKIIYFKNCECLHIFFAFFSEMCYFMLWHVYLKFVFLGKQLNLSNLCNKLVSFKIHNTIDLSNLRNFQAMKVMFIFFSLQYLLVLKSLISKVFLILFFKPNKQSLFLNIEFSDTTTNFKLLDSTFF